MQDLDAGISSDCPGAAIIAIVPGPVGLLLRVVEQDDGVEAASILVVVFAISTGAAEPMPEIVDRHLVTQCSRHFTNT